MPIVQVSVWEGFSPENKKKIVEGVTRIFEDLGVPKEAVEIVIYEAPKSNWAIGGKLHSEKYPFIPLLDGKGESEVESISSKSVDKITIPSGAKGISKTSLQNREFEEALLKAEELKAPIIEEPKSVSETVIFESERGTKLCQDRFIHEGKSYLISEMKHASTKEGFINALLDILFKNGKIQSFYVERVPNTTITSSIYSGFKNDHIHSDFKKAAEQWASAINALIALSS
jgi:4-oxalocrotonate tautomerase